MPAAVDIKGQRFGRLIVLGRAGHDDHRNAMWLCRCGCSRSVVASSSDLRLGRIVSCGCAKAERAVALSRQFQPLGAKATTKHGGARKTAPRHPLYATWKGMRQRCHYLHHVQFKDYGGRGIAVCEAWNLSFETFLADVGPKPSPHHTLDRIDPDGNYEPGNVRWATRSEQRRNLRRKR